MPRIVRIPGLDEPLSFPTGTPDQEIVSAVIDRLFPVAPIPEVPKPEAGFTGGFGEGITALGGLGTAVPYLVAPTEERRIAAAKAAEPEAEFQGLSDIEGVGDLFRFVREQAGQAVGFMAPPAAAALGAGAVSGPFAPIAAPAAFLTTAGLQYLGNTVGRQAQEQELKALKGEDTEPPEITKALMSSAGQAGLDLAGFKFFKPIGQVLGLAGRDVAEETAKDVVETAARGDTVGAAEKLIGKESVLLGAAKGSALEAAQEPIQSMLERYGAGLDLASDDAIQEYFEAAIAGGILGAPLGAGSTALGNVKRGAYDKKLITDLSNSISGKTVTQEELANEWDKAKASINSEVRPLSITDDMGNFVSYTPDYLSQFGVAPEASAINVGKRSVPMTNILGQSLENKEVAGVMHNFFVERMKAISDRFKEQARSLGAEERGALVKQYEMAAQGAKTMRTILTPQATLESPTNWTIRQSPDNPKKFELYNPVLGKVGAVDKEGKARLFSNTKTAGDFLKNKVDQDQREAVKEAEKATKEAEKVPKPVTTATKDAEAQKTLDEINAEQRVSAEADALAGLEADIRAGFGPEADRVFEKAQAYEDAGSSRLDALQKASTDVNQEIQADAEAETGDKAKVTQDKAKENEKLIKDLQKEQTTFDAQQKKAQKEADAAAKKEADARAAELERLRKEQETQKETQKETPKATQQISRIAEEIRAIDPDPDSEFSDVANMAGRARTLEEAMAVQDLAERLRRAYNTINSPAISAADKDAAANQVNKIYDELDAIQAAPPITAPAPKAPAPKKEEPTGEIARGLAESQAAARAAGETKVLAPEDLPIAEHERILQEAQAVYDARDKKLNKQEVKEAIEENGNAKEATKISNELKNQACD
jgi:hypothetical protein